MNGTKIINLRIIELEFYFDGNFDINIVKSSRQNDIDRQFLKKIISAFLEFPDNRRRLLECEVMRLKATMKDEKLSKYEIGWK
jgi:hypothetical protein